MLEQRIKDGILNDAPIFGDIWEFNRTYAKEFKGVADVITAGFPCQPFSVAGKRAGASDERNMWPATIESIRIIRPRYVLLENVPGLLTAPKLWLVALEKIRQVDIFGKANKNSLMSRLNRLIFKAFGVSYLGRIFGDLAESGYDIRWRCLSAAEVGANHRRNRLWVLAYNPDCGIGDKRQKQKIQRQEQTPEPTGICNNVADTIGGDSRRGRTIGKSPDERGQESKAERKGIQSRDGQARSDNIKQSRQDVADTANAGIERMRKRENQTVKSMADTTKPRLHEGYQHKTRQTTRQGGEFNSWWSVEPDLGRLAHGVPDRVDRLKAIGNAQVPAVVRAVWELLNDPE